MNEPAEKRFDKNEKEAEKKAAREAEEVLKKEAEKAAKKAERAAKKATKETVEVGKKTREEKRENQTGKTDESKEEFPIKGEGFVASEPYSGGGDSEQQGIEFRPEASSEDIKREEGEGIKKEAEEEAKKASEQAKQKTIETEKAKEEEIVEKIRQEAEAKEMNKIRTDLGVEISTTGEPDSREINVKEKIPEVSKKPVAEQLEEKKQAIEEELKKIGDMERDSYGRKVPEFEKLIHEKDYLLDLLRFRQENAPGFSSFLLGNKRILLEKGRKGEYKPVVDEMTGKTLEFNAKNLSGKESMLKYLKDVYMERERKQIESEKEKYVKENLEGRIKVMKKEIEDEIIGKEKAAGKDFSYEGARIERLNLLLGKLGYYTERSKGLNGFLGGSWSIAKMENNAVIADEKTGKPLNFKAYFNSPEKEFNPGTLSYFLQQELIKEERDKLAKEWDEKENEKIETKDKKDKEDREAWEHSFKSVSYNLEKENIVEVRQKEKETKNKGTKNEGVKSGREEVTSTDEKVVKAKEKGKTEKSPEGIKDIVKNIMNENKFRQGMPEFYIRSMVERGFTKEQLLEMSMPDIINIARSGEKDEKNLGIKHEGKKLDSETIKELTEFFKGYASPGAGLAHQKKILRDLESKIIETTGDAKEIKKELEGMKGRAKITEQKNKLEGMIKKLTE